MPPLKGIVDLSFLALDTETTGQDFNHGTKPYFVTTCDEAGNQFWWQWDVDPLTRGVNPPADHLIEIEEQINSHQLVLQNSKFDVRALNTIIPGIFDRWPWDRTHDTLILAHLLGSNQPKDLYSLGIIWLGVDERPKEEALKAAVKEARDFCRRKLPDWKIAREGLESMPSVKGSSSRDEDKPWKADGWLPRTLRQVGLFQDRPEWDTVLAEYANADSELTVALRKVMWAEVKHRGLEKIYGMRRRLPGVLAPMEQAGLGLSMKRLNSIRNEFTRDSQEAGETCQAIAAGMGHSLELPRNGVNNSLREMIYGVLKLEPRRNPKSKTSNPSIDKDAISYWLATLPPKSKERLFIKSLVAKRERDTAINFLDSYERFALPLKPGSDYHVLHPNLNPTATDTLRFNCVNPNAQQISKKPIYSHSSEGYKTLRAVFGPGPLREWWTMDYENIELRIPGYESEETAMIELFERPDDPPYFGSYHLLNASIVYPDLFWPLAEKKGEFKKQYEASWYQWIKNAGFALIYGCQEAQFDRTARKSGGYRLLREKLPKLFTLADRWIARAEKEGTIETLPDRTVDPRRGYPLLMARSEWGRIEPTKPLNYHVQGTAMWCTAKAMLRCHDFLKELNLGKRFLGRTWPGGYRMALQVHDEIVFDFPALGASNLPVVEECRRLMELSGNDIGVPLKVSVKWCPKTWADGETPPAPLNPLRRRTNDGTIYPISR